MAILRERPSPIVRKSLRRRRLASRLLDSDSETSPSRKSPAPRSPRPVERDEYLEMSKPREEQNFTDYYEGLDEFEPLPVLVQESRADDEYEEYRLKRKRQDREILTRLKRPSFRKMPDLHTEEPPIARNMIQFGYNSNKAVQKPTFWRPTDRGDGLITDGLTLDQKVRSLYDMDEQDATYLEHVNARLAKDGKHISLELFEVIMTYFEMEWCFIEKLLPPKIKNEHQNEEQAQLHAQLYGSDDGIGAAPEEDQCCAVCNRNECDNSNAIVFCDGCDIAVHQECYGVAFIPEGPWLCRKCLIARNQKNRCLFCPSVTGAFKQTDNGGWGHVICTLWINELYFANPVYMEPIEGIGNIPRSRWKLTCYICRQKVGACIQCCKPSCSVAYHVTCARRSDFYMEMKQGVQAAIHDKSTVVSYCDRHSPKEWDFYHDTKLGMQKTKLYYSTGKNRDSGNKIVISKAEKKELKDTKNHWFRWKTARGAPILPLVVIKKLDKMLQSYRIPQDINYLYEFAKYWTLKREATGGSLIRRPDTANLGVLTNKEIDERLQALDLIKQDILKLADISSLSLKKAKLELKSTNELLDQMEIYYLPMQYLIKELLDQFLKHDRNNAIISTTFEDSNVPSIKQIVEKVENHEYQLVSELVDDLTAVDNHVIQNLDPHSAVYRHIRNYWRRLRSQAIDRALTSERALLKGNRKLFTGLKAEGLDFQIKG
ncbi:hypothetical protein KL920_003214 [Ogataea angusta]|nr:hypothetical protein KL920_003214 [Ogataea angusta]